MVLLPLFSVACPESYQPYFESNKCLKVFTTKKTFADAKQFCHEQNGYLVSIANAFQNRQILEISASQGHYPIWLGLNTANNGELQWEDGLPVEYTNWRSGYPVIPSALWNCSWLNTDTGFGSGQWVNDGDCDSQKAFACEIIKESPCECNVDVEAIFDFSNYSNSIAWQKEISTVCESTNNWNLSSEHIRLSYALIGMYTVYIHDFINNPKEMNEICTNLPKNFKYYGNRFTLKQLYESIPQISKKLRANSSFVAVTFITGNRLESEIISLSQQKNACELFASSGIQLSSCKVLVIGINTESDLSPLAVPSTAVIYVKDNSVGINEVLGSFLEEHICKFSKHCEIY